MSTIDKIMGVMGVGSAITKITFFRRLVASVALLIALTAVSSVMVAALALAGFYGLYVAFVHYGADPVLVITGLGIFAASLTAIMVSIAVGRWREIRNFQYLSPAPLFGEAGKIADAFMQGLLREKH